MMNRYMIVVLQKAYRNDAFIEKLNQRLLIYFGSNNCIKFNPWYFLQEETGYINSHPELLNLFIAAGLTVTKETLHTHIPRLRHGEFHFKISGDEFTSDDARDAIAVSKWITVTKGQYIDRHQSKNFTPSVLKSRFHDVFIEAGYDLKALWKLP